MKIHIKAEKYGRVVEGALVFKGAKGKLPDSSSLEHEKAEEVANHIATALCFRWGARNINVQVGSK